MRLYPPVTQEEAESWLAAQAAETWGADSIAEMTPQIAAMASAMAALSAVRLDDDVEPMFP